MKAIERCAQNRFLRRMMPGVWWLLGETADSRSDLRPDTTTSYVPGGFRMSVNTVMLMINAIISATLGYPLWLMAARLFDPATVGLGSGAISAIRLCSQIALLGIGAAVTLLLPRQRQHPSDLLNVAITAAAASAVLFACGFLILSAAFFGQFRFLVVSPFYALAFLALNVVSVLAILLDSIFIALRRSDRVATRSIAQAIAALIILGVAGTILRSQGVAAILLAWIGAFVASAVLGDRYLCRYVAGYRFRPLATRSTAHALLHVGIPQSILKLVDRRTWLHPAHPGDRGAEPDRKWLLVHRLDVWWPGVCRAESGVGSAVRRVVSRARQVQPARTAVDPALLRARRSDGNWYGSVRSLGIASNGRRLRQRRGQLPCESW